MKNLNSVFAAYMIGWTVFFVYYISIARRTSVLREDIERLKNSLSRGKSLGREEKSRNRDVSARRAEFAGSRRAISAESISGPGHNSARTLRTATPPDCEAHFLAPVHPGRWPLRPNRPALADRDAHRTAALAPGRSGLALR